MLTNPNTVGLFDKNILKITEIVHNCGGLCYYDGANLNAVMGTVRPGDMGFDVIHLNLHKTFSTPHGGGGPGSGPVGCKSMLVPFLPSYVVDGEEELKFVKEPQSIGEMKSFYGNFTVIVKALTYVKTLGREGIPEASQNAVLNANYMMNKLKDLYTMAYDEVCMHEFVMSLADLKKKTGISAMDIAKGLLDNGIHPPTMYFPLIVDEAHGAHFGFDPYFPKSANIYGADLVINSLHKTLPALTQTALLHVNGDMVKRRKVKQYLDMLQTSSPSYILMASIDACIGMLEETLETHSDARSDYKYKNIFSEYANRIEALRKDLKRLKYLKIIQTDNTDRYDRSKFVISVKHAPMSSHELYEILLHRYHLQMEMLAGTYVLAMTTVGDTQEGLDRLRDALLEIDKEIDTKQGRPAAIETDLPLSGRQPALEKVWTIAEAVNRRDKIQKRSFEDSIGCISVEYAYLYPPGSPLIVPGERITKEAVEVLHWYQEHDFSIEGLQSEDGIEVWIDG